MNIYKFTLALIFQHIFISNAYSLDLTLDEKTSALKAGKYQLTDTKWHSDCNDPTEASFEPAVIEKIIDLNGDKLPEVIITEGSYSCYGNTGSGFKILTRHKDNSWQVILDGVGIPTILTIKSPENWPDIEIGGPGFCFPIMRWSSSKYSLNRKEYNGKKCNI